jgi:hypothetical protein
MMNECLYRQRHAYDYLLFMDADEFLVVRGCCKGGWCVWETVCDKVAQELLLSCTRVLRKKRACAAH